MSTRRIDFVDTDLVTGWGELDAMPKHTPVLRADAPKGVIRLHPVLTEELRKPIEAHPMPASMSRESTAGERAVVVVCAVTLISWGLLAVVSAVTEHDLFSYFLASVQQ